MRQFLYAGDLSFAALEQQATGACIVFREQTMPPGSRPATARVGFEVNEQDRSATLLVDRGIQFAASGDDSVSRWLSEGKLTFPSFRELRRWIQNDLRARYDSSYSPTPGRNQDSSLMTAGELTDLEAVVHHLPADSDVVHLDEEDLFRRLAGRIRGQNHAIRLMARHVRRHLARKTPRRPATLMALGPTGVGKTSSAEYLPTALQSQLTCGGAYNYLRLDMSEYQERHRISQLLGAPQGYVGYGDGAQLVDTLAANPRTVVLFDEIEKAHPDILRTLMNAMDAGRLSAASASGGGRQIDCRRAIFIFTANLDATGILQELENRDAFGNRATVDSVCRNRLRSAGLAPELVGRIGCFLVFRPLDRKARAEVVTLAIARVAEEYGLRVTRIDPTAVADILRMCPAVGFGARPDEYFIDELLGPCFGVAAATGSDEPMAVIAGPPLQCVPAEEPASNGPRGEVVLQS
jgi:hypothetical protein